MRQKMASLVSGPAALPVEHYTRLLLRRKWLVLGVWALVSAVTAIIAYRLPNIYTSDTLILVDPQKVPEAYVKSTVTGDVRNRLGTLSQQILSETKLNSIIQEQNLYSEERKAGMAREDIITKMRSDVSVKVVSDFGGSQDLQAFRITYRGKDARLVALVTTQLANLFISENLQARQDQAQGTTQFLLNELQEARKQLEAQEAKLRDFKLKHIGEMPKQEAADLQLLAQAQSQLQMESDAANRAEQQRTYIQSMMTQSAPVVEVDEDPSGPKAANDKGPQMSKTLAAAKAQLATMRSRYTDSHPDIQKLKRLIEDQEAKEAAAAASAAVPDPAPAMKRQPRAPVNHFNPVLQSQLKALDAEIEQHKQEQQRLAKVVGAYRAKLDAIPFREQEISALERDYEMSKTHYSQLLDKQLSAQTATELEYRQKGEKFKVLDPAMPAERPTQPNRILINIAGSLGGLILGLMLATGKEFFGMSIITAQDMLAVTSLPILGEIPVIETQIDKRVRRKWILVAAASVLIAGVACAAILFYHSRIQI